MKSSREGPPHHAEQIHGLIRRSQLVILEWRGHVTLIEVLESFARLCLDPC